MEKVVLAVTNNTGVLFDDGLKEVNKLLKDGWEVKDFKPVAECVSSGGDGFEAKGKVYAYFVL